MPPRSLNPKYVPSIKGEIIIIPQYSFADTKCPTLAKSCAIGEQVASERATCIKLP